VTIVPRFDAKWQTGKEIHREVVEADDLKAAKKIARAKFPKRKLLDVTPIIAKEGKLVIEQPVVSSLSAESAIDRISRLVHGSEGPASHRQDESASERITRLVRESEERENAAGMAEDSDADFVQKSSGGGMYAGYFQVFELVQGMSISKDAPYLNMDKAIDAADKHKKFNRSGKFVVREIRSDGGQGNVVYSTG
jgi:hypothetical protein